VVYKPPGKQWLMVRLPYWGGNRAWLLAGGRLIEWLARFKAWSLPRGRFDAVVKRCLSCYGSCYLIQVLRERVVCCEPCWNAEGYDCECSCMGVNHGSGHPLQHEISEAVSLEWQGHKLSCRLLTRGLLVPLK